jgi:hypothetical protein
METKTKLTEVDDGKLKKLEAYLGLTDKTERRLIAKDVLCALISKTGLYHDNLIKDALSITDTFLKLESE